MDSAEFKLSKSVANGLPYTSKVALFGRCRVQTIEVSCYTSKVVLHGQCSVHAREVSYSLHLPRGRLRHQLTGDLPFLVTGLAEDRLGDAPFVEVFTVEYLQLVSYIYTVKCTNCSCLWFDGLYSALSKSKFGFLFFRCRVKPNYILSRTHAKHDYRSTKETRWPYSLRTLTVRVKPPDRPLERATRGFVPSAHSQGCYTESPLAFTRFWLYRPLTSSRVCGL